MSPHLNPIENLWGDLKSSIGERNPANVPKLEHIAKEVWEKIPSEKCKKLIDGYKKRLEAAIGQRVCNQILRMGANTHAGFLFFPLELQYLC